MVFHFVHVVNFVEDVSYKIVKGIGFLSNNEVGYDQQIGEVLSDASRGS